MPSKSFPRPFRYPTPLTAAALALSLAIGLPAGSAAAPADERAARYYEDALSRYQSRDVAGAIVQLKNALQIDRGMLPVHVLLGKALLANGEAAAAEVELNEALRLGVDRAEVVLPLAQALLAQGKPRAILEQAAFAPSGLPAAVQRDVLLLRATASSDLGEARAALDAITAARAVDPRAAATWLAEVPLRVRARQWVEAALALDKALALAPDAAEVWYQKGSLAHMRGNLAGALAAYDKALLTESAHTEARLTRAGLLIDLGRDADAARDVEQLRRQSPREPRAAYLQALLAERAGSADAARAALRDVTALIDPVPPDFLRYRPQLLMLGGLAHFGLGQSEKARPYLETALRQHGQGPASKLLAQISLSERNHGRAAEILEAYLRSQPGDAQAMTLLAAAYMAQGHHQRASALIQQALRQNDTPGLRTALGLSQLGSGQAGDALTSLEVAYAKDPTQTQAASALVGLYLRTARNAKALEIAQSLVRRVPDNPAFQNLHGLALARAGNATAARQAFDRAIALDPRQLPAHLNLARLDMAQHAFDAAAQRLGTLLQNHERDIDVLLELAAVEVQRGRPADAQRWLEKARDHAGSRDPRPGLALVDLHLRGEHPAAALEAARRLAGHSPENVAALLAHARALLAQRDTAGARTVLGNATRLANFDAPLQTRIAGLQLAAGHLAGAAYSVEKALSGHPDFLPALAVMVEVELRQGDLAKAEQRARAIAQREPASALGHTLVGQVALARGQPVAALAALRQAHQVQPSSDTLLRLFRATYAHDSPKSALHLGRRWLAAHPQDAAAQRALADALAATGDFAAATAAYRALLDSAPDDAQVLNNLANALLRQADPAALSVAERALARAPGNALVIDTVGWASYHAGQHERALQLLRDARLRAPGNAEIRYHLAVVLAQTGRPAEARDELTAALADGAGLESTAPARALLKSLPR